MKRTKKIVTLALAMMLVICTTVMATIAYLQDTTQTVTNTMTVGKVGITLDEAVVDEYGVEKTGRTETGNEYKLIPDHKYVKDPTVHVVADSEESYIRMIVTITDLAEVKAVFNVAEEEYFLPQNFVEGWDNSKWITTNEVIEKDNTATYEFRYHTTVSTVDSAKEDLEPLFTHFKVPDYVDGDDLEKLANMEIRVVAHAIQADGFVDTVEDGVVIKTAEENAWAAFNPDSN